LPVYRAFKAHTLLDLANDRLTRREDLEDMLADPMYFQAIFHSLERVKSLYQAQAELGMANESIASMLALGYTLCPLTYSHGSIENNLAQQDRLYQARSETQAAFDEAKALEARWKELDKEQKELYQVYTGRTPMLYACIQLCPSDSPLNFS
jgi:ESCRT-I complex subunit VPS37